MINGEINDSIQSTSHNEIFRGQIFMEFYQIEQFKIE